MNAAGAGWAVCGGGTGGHIYPALAVAAELRRLAPGDEIYFLGKEGGMEQELASRAGLSFYGLPAAGLERNLTPRNVVALWKAMSGTQQALKLFHRLPVKAILGTGGFVCGPVILAAAMLRIPSIVHESNAVPGLTNKLLGAMVTRVAVAYPEAAAPFPAKKTVVTGFPLRPDLNRSSREEGCLTFGLDPAKRVLLVFPGSLAARRVNRAVAEVLPKLFRRMPDLQILWMTGKADYALARRLVEKFALPVTIREFIHEVPAAYAAADLVLARAGAGTLAELAATGKPAILVPYPYATHNHQERNAGFMLAAGSAELLADESLDGDALLEKVREVFAKLEGMTQRAAELRARYPQGAAEVLAKMLLALAADRTPSAGGQKG